MNSKKMTKEEWQKERDEEHEREEKDWREKNLRGARRQFAILVKRKLIQARGEMRPLDLIPTKRKNEWHEAWNKLMKITEDIITDYEMS